MPCLLFFSMAVGPICTEILHVQLWLTCLIGILPIVFGGAGTMYLYRTKDESNDRKHKFESIEEGK